MKSKTLLADCWQTGWEVSDTHVTWAIHSRMFDHEAVWMKTRGLLFSKIAHSKSHGLVCRIRFQGKTKRNTPKSKTIKDSFLARISCVKKDQIRYVLRYNCFYPEKWKIFSPPIWISLKDGKVLERFIAIRKKGGILYGSFLRKGEVFACFTKNQDLKDLPVEILFMKHRKKLSC